MAPLYRWDNAATSYVNLHTGEPLSPPAPASITVGANYPGTSTYPVPTEGDVMFVAPNGNNSNTGSMSGPKLTVQAAVAAASTGTTIVMRAGTYREAFTTPSGKVLTIQAYPGEEVWWDGSAVYSSWTSNGNGTWTAPYSVTFTRFNVNGFNGDDPYRNHPDQVWVNGAPLTQIADNSTPGSGQFSVNQAADTLTIGTDPTGKTVRVTELSMALTVTDTLTLRGFGVRRYSPQAMEGLNAMIYFGGTSHGSVLEHMHFEWSAMVSVTISKTNVRVSDCTFQDNGNSGLMVSNCDGFILERCIIRRINRGQWQAEPTTAAIKLARGDQVHIRYNQIEECPKAYGIWFDVSCTRKYIYGNTVNGGGTMMNAVEIELSDGGYYDGVQYYSVVASNRLSGATRKNAGAALLLFDTGYVRVWNNELLDSGIPLYLWQDERYNHESGNVLTYEICPWLTRGIEIGNNHLSSGSGANIQLAAYANTGNFGLLGANMFDKLAGNWFAPAPPGSMSQLGKSDGSRNSYNSPSALAAAGSEVGTIAGKLGTNYQGTTAPSNAIAAPLPAQVADLLGVPTGTAVVGPITPPLVTRT